MTVLSFSRPAREWLEALPLGNGRLGAMCFGGARTVRFDLNDETVWSGSTSSEAGQPHPDAETARADLALARALLAAGDPGAAAEPVMRMQSDYSQAYLPLATLTLRLPDAGAGPESETGGCGYRRTLDLTTGLHETVSGEPGDLLRQRTIVSAPDGVLVHLIEGLATDAPVVVTIDTPLQRLPLPTPAGSLESASPASEEVVLFRAPSDVPPTHEPDFPAARWDDTGAGGAVEGALLVRRVPAGPGRIAFLVTSDTTYGGLGRGTTGSASDAAARASARLDTAEALGVDALFARAEADQASLLGRVRLTLGPDARTAEASPDTGARFRAAFAHPDGPLASDPGLAAVLFDYGRYLLASSSRPGGLPATLQGIWNDSMQPPWSSSYTLNINLQMNYWAAGATDLGETAEPLIDFVAALAAAGTETAARLYGSPGWVAHHNSDAWLATAPVGARHGDPSWAFWPMAGPWLVRHLWEHARFGGAPDGYLRDTAWPVIRGAAEFGAAWLVPLADGTLGTSPSTSPENTYRGAEGEALSLTTSSALDLQLLRDLFETTLAVAAELQVDDDVTLLVRRRLRALPTTPAITPDGSIAEWAGAEPGREPAAVDPHHRHVSPLYFVYPGETPLTEGLKNAATEFLERRGDDSTGWSLVWKTALWARLGRPDKVSDLLRLFFRDARTLGEGDPATAATTPSWAGGLYPNLFAAHPPFQIDGNLGFVAALTETLLQSHGGVIELLPALPGELGEGTVRGLVARPGIHVDLEWRAGRLVGVGLRTRDPRVPAHHRIRYRGHEVQVTLSPAETTRLTADDFTESSSTR